MDKMQALANWLKTQGELVFDDFVVKARAAGHDPAMWLRAKQSGLISTVIRSGVHYIKAL